MKLIFGFLIIFCVALIINCDPTMYVKNDKNIYELGKLSSTKLKLKFALNFFHPHDS